MGPFQTNFGWKNKPIFAPKLSKKALRTKLQHSLKVSIKIIVLRDDGRLKSGYRSALS